MRTNDIFSTDWLRYNQSMRRIRTLPHLQAFEAAARYENFSLAAAELCLTTSAVSRHIKNLEEKLGEVLFHRRHKQVILTPKGRTFALACRKLLDDLAAAESGFTGKHETSHITINCLPTFAVYWLIPRLADFHQAYPHIHINVVTGTGTVTPGSDIAVRRDPIHFPDTEPRAFLEEKSVLVCGAEYHLNHLVSNSDNTLIHIRIRNDLWKKWASEKYPMPDDITRQLYFDHTYGAIQAAEENLGIALVPLIFCEKHIKSGRLITLDSFGTLTTGTYYYILQSDENPAICAFIDWLAGHDTDKDYKIFPSE